MALTSTCKRHGDPYVKSMMGVKDDSIEPRQICPISKNSYKWICSAETQRGRLTHVFVTEFKDRDERDFFMTEDRNHLATFEKLSVTLSVEFVAGQAVDFTPNEF